MTFHCEIGGTDYGPEGLGALRGLDIEPADHGAVGQFHLTLRSLSGGYTFTPMQSVAIYEKDGLGNVDFRWVGGFVIDPVAGRIKGTEIETWVIDCADYNLLLDGLVGPANSVIHVASDASIAAQVLSLVQQLQGAGVRTGINAVEAVADIYNDPLNPLPDHYFRGKSLRTMLEEICASAQQLDSALRPRFRMDVEPTGVTFGSPCLYLYDGALEPPASVAFSDSPTGAEKPIYGEFIRHLAGPKLVNRRQLIWDTPDPKVVTAFDATSAQDYPNPYIDHGVTVGGNTGYGYWMAEPVEDHQAGSSAEAQARIDALVASTKDARETITFQTAEKVRPGDIVTLTWSLRGLVAVTYRVVGVSIAFPTNQYTEPRISLTLGQRRLEWFEDGDEGIDVPPQLRPGPPEPPTSPAIARQWWDYQRGVAVAHVTWTASPSATVVGYDLVYTFNSLTVVLQTQGRTTAQALIDIAAANTDYSLTIYARDGQGRRSEGTTPVLGTTPAPVNTRGIFNGTFEQEDDTDSTQAAGWTVTETASGTGERVPAGTGGGISVAGKYMYAMTVTANALDKVSLVSDPVSIISADTFGLLQSYAVYVRAAYYTTLATGTVTLYADLYAQDDSLVTTVTVGSGTPTTFAVTLFETQTASSGAVYLRLRVEYQGAGTANTVYWSGVMVEDAVMTNRVKNNAITTTKINNLAVTSAKLGTGAVTAGKIATGGISAATQFAAGVVDAAAIATGAVGTDELADNAVTDAKVSTLTDPTNFLFDIQTNIWYFRDASNNNIGRFSFDNVNSITQLMGAGTASLLVGATTGNAIKFTLSDGGWWIGARGVSVATKNANFTADDTTEVYLVTTGATDKTATLPASSGRAGRTYTFKKVDNGAGQVLVDGNASETIDGAANNALAAQWKYVTVVSDGTNWVIVAAG